MQVPVMWSTYKVISFRLPGFTFHYFTNAAHVDLTIKYKQIEKNTTVLQKKNGWFGFQRKFIIYILYTSTSLFKLVY